MLSSIYLYPHIYLDLFHKVFLMKQLRTGATIQAYLGYCVTPSNYGLSPGYMAESMCRE
jgi:hypothetical protein